MNRPVTQFLPPSVQLGQARTRTFGRLTIHPGALEIVGEGRAWKLKPGGMKVLLALLDAEGQVLTRDDLLARCWDGRIVSDSAINRCVLEVRAALAGEPRAQLETVIKIGYRLRLAPEGEAEPPARAPGLAFRRRGAALAAGAVLVVLIALGLHLRGREEAWAAEAVRPLTGEPGVEAAPALSADGRLLAYVAERPEGRAIVLRTVGEESAVTLTDPAWDASRPAWSPDGQRLAFVRPVGGACEIWVMAALGGAPRRVGPCGHGDPGRIAWITPDALVFSYAGGPQAPRRLRSLDLATGTARDLTAPPPGARGDSEPAVSPDGRRILFNRTFSYGVDNLQVGELRDGAIGRVRPLTTDGWKALGSAWSADGRTVFFTSNRGGDRGLWAVDVRSRGGEPRRVAVGIAYFQHLSADRRGAVAAEVVRSRRNLAWLTASGSAGISDSTSTHWDPDVSQDGAVAFVSLETGAPELWVAEPGGRAARLTELRRSYVHGPHWSPDGRRLAFVSTAGREPQAHVIDRDGGGLRQVTDLAGEKRDAVFARSGRALVFLHWTAEGVGLTEAPLDGRPPGRLASLGVGWRSLKAGPDGALYGLKAGDPRLWRIDADLARAAPLQGAPPIGEAHSWAVGPDGVHVARLGGLGRPVELVLYPWVGAVRRVALLPASRTAPIFAVHPGTGAVVFERAVEEEGDIVRLTLARR